MTASIDSILGELLSPALLLALGFFLYFSASSWATVGYGGIVLLANSRMLGPLETTLRVLMCGISVSLLFAIVTRLTSRDMTAAQLAGGTPHAGTLPSNNTLQTQR